ncbi:MAG TPA: UDP-N-acetyl-D-glucosamine dehydrogenase, partial [Bryobacterales bacterium]|nr:UDP-N-acetyl-D-glucosamine dehydrogenase [Bryobacterales bacterium]
MAKTVKDLLAEKIRRKEAKAGVVGLGYVGLPLAVEFARVGFPVTGIDVNQSKVDEVNAGRSYVKDVPDSALAPLTGDGRLRATADF